MATSGVLRKILRVFEQINDVENYILNLTTAHDPLRLERKYPFTYPLELQPRCAGEVRIRDCWRVSLDCDNSLCGRHLAMRVVIEGNVFVAATRSSANVPC